jgi:predicted ATPase
MTSAALGSIRVMGLTSIKDLTLELPTAVTVLIGSNGSGKSNIVGADELSDGTLRFICRATLLLQPERPGTVVLDEPELGLHPFAINQLAGLVRAASTDGRKVILATQSVTLLSHFDAAELAIVERGSNGTTVNRLHVDELTDWLPIAQP